MNSPWFLIFLAGVNSTIGNLMLKKASSKYHGEEFITGFLNLWFMGGLIFYTINVLLFATALKTLPVSAAYPVLAGFGFALLALTGSLLLKENLNLVQYAGVLIVLTGIAIICYAGG